MKRKKWKFFKQLWKNAKYILLTISSYIIYIDYMDIELYGYSNIDDIFGLIDDIFGLMWGEGENNNCEYKKC